MPGSPKRVAIRTLGCKVNRTESESLAESLLGADVVVVDDPADADIVVVNTCTVTGEADAKARKEVRRALAACPGAVVVAGCLAALDAEGLRSLGDRVVVEPRREALAARVAEIAGAPATRVSGPDATVRSAAGGESFRTRVMLKVQDGCDRRCSYCIVPDARGLPRSVPAGELAPRVRALVDGGTSEVVLTGINIGRYSDPSARVADLADLVDVLTVAGAARLRISSIEPLDLTQRFADALARAGARVAPHLHVPLQSGCDRTLAEMRRGYTTADFASALGRVRAAVPGIAITTDVIVGFPGETDADFEASLAFVESCGLARLHVFRYSRRTGTPAAQRADQVAPPAIASRAARMRALSDRLAERHARSREGGRATVLVERVSKDSAAGTTEDGLHVRVPAAAARPGDLLEVTLARDASGALVGLLEGAPSDTSG